MGTFTIDADADGYQGNGPYGPYWGYPLSYTHKPSDDSIRYQDVWTGTISGGFFILHGKTDFMPNDGGFNFSMQVNSATFYKPTESIEGVPQAAIEIGTATFETFTWSGAGGYLYDFGGSIIGYTAYIQYTNSSADPAPGSTPWAGNAFGGHIASMDLKFNGSNVADHIDGGMTSGAGRLAEFFGNDGDDTIYGSYYANNKIYGGSGADHLVISTLSVFDSQLAPRSQLIDGGDGNDYIEIFDQLNGDATLLGGSGDDQIIASGNGAIIIEGGAGNDNLTKNSTANKVTVRYSGAAADYVITSLDTNNGLYEVVDVRAGSTDGRDALNRVDFIEFSNGIVDQTAVATDKRAIVGTDQQDSFVPGQYEGENFRFVYSNIIYAHGGDDFIDGGYNADTMIGGLGNDTYVVDDVNDLVVEAASEGVDTVLSSVSYELAANVENLTLTGDAYLNGTGNSLANAITGNAGANVLNGGTGADTLIGGLGDDTYVTDGGDTITEAANAGTDTVQSSATITLGANLENLTLTGNTSINGTGNALVNTIIGNGSANVLNGGAGADLLSGLAGNDIYYVDNADDRVIETVGGGNDSVGTSVSYALTAGQEIERLGTTSSAGTAAINLTGNEFAQTLVGNAGNNALNGRGGADTMYGYAGNDIYYVDNAADQVIEAINGGTDAVGASVSYVLAKGQSIETLSTTSSAGTAAINLTGNELAQTIRGNAGANALKGGGGGDSLYGLGGDDTYYVYASGDKVFEAANQGNDTVAANVHFALAAGQSIETMATFASAGTTSINLTGNEVGQSIRGNAGANVLNGKGGTDVLTGLGGADTFVFDTALGSGNVDRIADFATSISKVHDTIQLAKGIFTALAPGDLSAAAFKETSAGTVDANDRILYDKTTGALSYDSDGLGAAAAVQFATLDNKVALSHLDFFVV